MWAHTIIWYTLRVIYWPLNIVALVTTFISGILAALPLVGLLWILLTSVIWQVFLWPLLLLSWAWHRTHWTIHPLLALVGIPLAILGDTFVKLIGAMSPIPEDRIGWAVKQTTCQQWPYAQIQEDGVRPVERMMDVENVGFIRASILWTDYLTRAQLGLAQ